MSLFTSPYEKRLWLWTLVVVIAIFSTLFLGQPLTNLFSSQDFRAAVFLLVMFLIAVTTLLYGLKSKPGKIEITVWLGLAAVYIMFVLRLGMPERSHLMEYSVLTIFIHKAITERGRQGSKISWPSLLTFVIAFLFGVLDECLQLMIPNRVFDPNDIVFNGAAAALVLGSILLLKWVRKKTRKA